MFRISEGQYELGGLTVLAVWVFVILPLANHSGTHNMLDAAVKIAPLISAVIVSLSLPTSLAVAVYTIYRNHKIQQSLKAQDLWSTYLQKAIDPALAYPAGCAKRFDYKARTVLNAENKPDKDEFERYEWFVSYLLLTSKEILQHFPHDDFWIKTVGNQIRSHKAYFVQRIGKPDDFVALSGSDVKPLIDEVLREE
jgi:hypothetical protein